MGGGASKDKKGGDPTDKAEGVVPGGGDAKTTYSKNTNGAAGGDDDSSDDDMDFDDGDPDNATIQMQKRQLKDESHAAAELVRATTPAVGKARDSKRKKERRKTIVPAHMEEESIHYEEHHHATLREVETEAQIHQDKAQLLMQMLPFSPNWDAQTFKLAKEMLNDVHPGYRDDYGNTLLIVCIAYRQVELAKMLLSKGSDANAQNTTGVSALHMSCSASEAAVTDGKYDPNKDCNMQIELVEALVGHGAVPDVREATQGCTPLHYAASSGSKRLVEKLLEKGANPGIRDLRGFFPVDYATQGHFDALREMMNDRYKEMGGTDGEGHGVTDLGWQKHPDPATGQARRGDFCTEHFFFFRSSGAALHTQLRPGSLIPAECSAFS